jgi:hypothetical protein
MGKQLPTAATRRGRRIQPTDSYGLVLALIIVDYTLLSTLSTYPWGAVGIVMLLGLTLLFALRTSDSRMIWQVLAGVYLVATTLFAIAGAFIPGITPSGHTAVLSAGLLLVVTPFVILRRIIMHEVVTAETIMGAISVYLLIGFSFASIYATIGVFGPSPFFADTPRATVNDYLFFSYTTLTTVGYGNLVPAGNVGRTFAMFEALLGQIYLVIIVARLVSLWAPATRSSQDHQRGTSQTREHQRDTEATTSPVTRPMPPGEPR